ncbi:hypothetical protein [Vibrio sp. MA40-2]|uniref:hypothetical protein n=1 Tax=Vibrio sp. MA40-2 TaxID=3391828 RepID=UPI0039A5BC45
MIRASAPLPTDNIYKFFALFGLVIMVTGCVMFSSMHEQYNERIYSAFLEASRLEQIEKPSALQEKQLEVAETRYEISISDKGFYVTISGIITALGVILMILGFYHWMMYIQPEADRFLKVRLEKAELELLREETELEKANLELKQLKKARRSWR